MNADTSWGVNMYWNGGLWKTVCSGSMSAVSCAAKLFTLEFTYDDELVSDSDSFGPFVEVGIQCKYFVVFDLKKGRKFKNKIC